MRVLIIAGLISLTACGTAYADQSNAGNGDGVTAVAVTAAPSAPPAFVPLAKYENSGLGGLYSSSPDSLSNYINKVFTIALSLGAMAAVLRLVYAGYLYMMSDLWTSKQHSTGIIRDVTIGVLLLLSIYLILQLINPDLLNLNILRDVKTTSGSGTTAPASPVSTNPTTVTPSNIIPSNCTAVPSETQSCPTGQALQANGISGENMCCS